MAGTALIAGATGAASKRLVEALLAGRDWSVIGLSRNPPHEGNERLRYIKADLLDADRCKAALTGCRETTHVFYTARAKFGGGGVETVDENVAMLRNVLDAVEAIAPGLVRVHLVGMHLGSMQTPAREDDPRHMPPNFYYDQEDLLRARQAGRRWTWSASRPGFIYDFAPERPRNLVSIIGVWAAICAELATAPVARNQAYNVTDGGLIRWRRFWPRLADHFGMKLGDVRPLTLAEWMADKGPVWNRIVAKHGLKPTRMEQVAVWAFGDFLWQREHDVISSVVKLRQHGFHDTIDTEAQVLAYLRRYREEKVLP